MAFARAIPVPAPLDMTLRKDVKDFELRILPLGASIVWGKHSSTGNGFRKPLRDQLVSAGWKVNMVGSKKNGEMIDNEVEAHPGDTIRKASAAASKSLKFKPNVVLINAGTNDCRLNIDIPNVGKRMRSLIEDLIKADGMKDTLVVLSTLLPSGNKAITKNSPSVNKQYRELVDKMRSEGVSIVLADMNPPDGGWIQYPKDFKLDGKLDDTHPGDEGYEKMALVWYMAIQKAAAQNLIKAPK
ncbi:SGNH hydrolase-type esterase domain-containing protein [Aspergillus unguis]